MAKQRNQQEFTFVVNGKAYIFSAYTTDTRSGFCHHILYNGEHTRVSYYNRTWESFPYQTALRQAISKFPKAEREALLKESDNYSEEYARKIDKEFAPLIALAKAIGTLSR